MSSHPTYDLASLEWSPSRATVELAEGESAVNPASTSRLIYGPALVTYERGPDGGIDVRVEDAPS